MNPSDAPLPAGDPSGSTILAPEAGADVLLNALEKIQCFLMHLDTLPTEPSLVFTHDGTNVVVHPIGDGLRVGRGATNDIYFTPAPEHMSRVHFVIELSDGRPVLRDLSSHGTRVRARKVKEMENQCRVLVDGDFIEAAGKVFVYLEGTRNDEAA